MVLPQFNTEGLLPVGDYQLSFQELYASHLVVGNGSSETWDSQWRNQLVTNLEIMVLQLWDVGIDRIFIDGSFVEDKDHPGDIDGYFECDLRYLATGQLERDLNVRDPFKVWTWDPKLRRLDRNSAKLQLPMWHTYRVELYPHYPNRSGVPDEFGNLQPFPAAFRKSRTCNRPKGIVQLIR